KSIQATARSGTMRTSPSRFTRSTLPARLMSLPRMSPSSRSGFRRGLLVLGLLRSRKCSLEMEPSLNHIYDGLSSVPAADKERLIYSAAPLPMYPGSFVGKDSRDRACILVAVNDQITGHHAPIRLESLEVQFDVPSRIKALGQVNEGTFTVVRCRSLDPELTRY